MSNEIEFGMDVGTPGGDSSAVAMNFNRKEPMTEDTTNTEVVDQPHADASIDLRMQGAALQINIAGPEDQMANEAVHFAHWIGRNLQALSAMAKQDFEQRQAVSELAFLANAQAQAIHGQEATKKLVVEGGGRKLLGPDAKPLN